MSFTISNNPQVNPLTNVTLSSKGVFIDKCNTASKFNRLDAMGNQLDTLYVLFLFLSLFFMIYTISDLLLKTFCCEFCTRAS